MIIPDENRVRIPAPAQQSAAGQTAQTNTAGTGNTTAAQQTAQTGTEDTGTAAAVTPRTDQPRPTNYESTMQALRQAQFQTPSFASSYDDQISSLYDQIINRKPFSYDASKDPLYQQYREQYIQGGRQAMRDTMGQAAALTGGYGSSYGEAVGQQQYNAYLSRLNEVMPELYGQAYSRWADEGNALTTNLGLASALRSADYDQFRDQLSDERYAFAQAVTEAEQRAQYGDFSGYADLYGEDEARRMLMSWAAANPLAAYTNGDITGEEFYNLTGQYPVGFQGGLAGYSGGGGGAWTGVDYDNRGHSRATIQNVQQRLHDNGYYNARIDGLAGDKTDAAIAAWNEAHPEDPVIL